MLKPCRLATSSEVSPFDSLYTLLPNWRRLLQLSYINETFFKKNLHPTIIPLEYSSKSSPTRKRKNKTKRIKNCKIYILWFQQQFFFFFLNRNNNLCIASYIWEDTSLITKSMNGPSYLQFLLSLPIPWRRTMEMAYGLQGNIYN